MIESLKDVNTLFLDVDGVFTDGKVSITENGDEIKSFDVKDGLGLILLPFAGIQPVIVSARKSNLVAQRFKELNVDEVQTGIIDKRAFIKKYMKANEVKFRQAAIIGDDLTDLAAFDLVFFRFAPNDAVKQVRMASNYL